MGQHLCPAKRLDHTMHCLHSDLGIRPTRRSGLFFEGTQIAQNYQTSHDASVFDSSDQRPR